MMKKRPCGKRKQNRKEQNNEKESQVVRGESRVKRWKWWWVKAVSQGGDILVVGTSALSSLIINMKKKVTLE